MSNYPNIIIHTCSESINNVDFIDIDYTSANLFNLPTITVTLSADVSAFVSNITTSSARINFSSKFVGTVNYSVISIK